MVRKNTFFLLFMFTGVLLRAAPSISYTVSMPEPHSHYFHVEMKINDLEGPHTDLSMPVWAPGSYLNREFARHIDFFESFDKRNKPLAWTKIDKDTWRVNHEGRKEILVRYRVYAFELSVRTSHLDDSHGYITGTSVFMYLDGFTHLPLSLKVIPHPDFSRISTALPYAGKPGQYFARDYHQLVDCPIEIGNHEMIRFEVDGVEHEMAMYGNANYGPVRKTLVADMKRLIADMTAIFGENPNDYYLFIIHHTDRGGGALEHENSTTFLVDRWTYTPGRDYINFLSLVVHEYFHVWNVKRIKPASLMPYVYDREMYTDLLWMLEGLTSYYDEILLSRAGLMTQTAYIEKLNGAINSIERSPGLEVMSVAQASFDAWIRYYRPNENSVNATISYYTKGNVLAAMLDLEILQATGGTRRLDDVLYRLYHDYYKKGRGIDMDILRTTIEKVAGRPYQEFFQDHVYGTEPVEYKRYLQEAGYAIFDYHSGSGQAFLGAGLADEGGRTMVKSVIAGSAAAESGVYVGDELIALNGFRVDTEMVFDLVSRQEPGDTVTLTYSRNGMVREKRVRLMEDKRSQYRIYPLPEPSEEQEALRRTWLLKQPATSTN